MQKLTQILCHGSALRCLAHARAQLRQYKAEHNGFHNAHRAAQQQHGRDEARKPVAVELCVDVHDERVERRDEHLGGHDDADRLTGRERKAAALGVKAGHEPRKRVGQYPKRRRDRNAVAQKLVQKRPHEPDGKAVQRAEEQRAEQE